MNWLLHPSSSNQLCRIPQTPGEMPQAAALHRLHKIFWRGFGVFSAADHANSPNFIFSAAHVNIDALGFF
jgi:hypothetical protein